MHTKVNVLDSNQYSIYCRVVTEIALSQLIETNALKLGTQWNFENVLLTLGYSRHSFLLAEEDDNVTKRLRMHNGRVLDKHATAEHTTVFVINSNTVSQSTTHQMMQKINSVNGRSVGVDFLVRLNALSPPCPEECRAGILEGFTVWIPSEHTKQGLQETLKKQIVELPCNGSICISSLNDLTNDDKRILNFDQHIVIKTDLLEEIVAKRVFPDFCFALPDVKQFPAILPKLRFFIDTDCSFSHEDEFCGDSPECSWYRHVKLQLYNIMADVCLSPDEAQVIVCKGVASRKFTQEFIITSDCLVRANFSIHCFVVKYVYRRTASK